MLKALLRRCYYDWCSRCKILVQNGTRLKTKRWPSCQTCWDLVLPGGAVSLLRILEGLILFRKRHHLTIMDQGDRVSCDSSRRELSLHFTGSSTAVQKLLLVKMWRPNDCRYAMSSESGCSPSQGWNSSNQSCTPHVGAKEPTELSLGESLKVCPKPPQTSGTHHTCEQDIHHHVDYFVIYCPSFT